MNRLRFVLRGGAVAALVVGAMLVPLPFRIYAPTALRPEGARTVYVTLAGRLTEPAHAPATDDANASLTPTVRPGERVSAGQVLAVLVNEEVVLEVARLEGDRNRLARRLVTLEARRGNDPSAAAALPSAAEALRDAEARLRERARDQQRLTLAAPIAGYVLPPPPVVQEPPPEGDLPVRRTWPLEDFNRGCPLETGEAFCQIGDPARLEAMLLVDQSQVQWVRLGQRVAVQLDEAPGRPLAGSIVAISQRSQQRTVADPAAGELLAVERRGSARPVLTQSVYEVRVALELGEVRPSVNATGRARISASPRSLGNRLAHYLRSTFRFRW